jgi:hypothetical protein
MGRNLTADDARQSLLAHVEARGVEVFCQYRPQLDWPALQRLLADRAQVRYPTEIVFDAAALQPGEFAHPEQKSERPEDGFTMWVHPRFAGSPARAIPGILYQLVAVNYGSFASSDEAETFGAAALGLTRDEYYAVLCALADEVGAAPAIEFPFPSAAGGCSCGGH